jgi:hypothetical protein
VDALSRLKELYSAVREAYLREDLGEIRRIISQIEEMAKDSISGEEYLQVLTYDWPCRSLEAHYQLRTKNYLAAIEIASRIKNQQFLPIASAIPEEIRSSTEGMAELSSLYILGTVKWIGPAEYENAVIPPAQMLDRWIVLLDMLKSPDSGGSKTLRTRLRISGQTVIQTGLRFCPDSVGEAMALFNAHYGTILNSVLRDYLSNPAPPDDCYLYWSIELAKVMYNGDMNLIELELLISRERRALLMSGGDEVDIAYAEMAYNSFIPSIARRFCIDFNADCLPGFCEEG